LRPGDDSPLIQNGISAANDLICPEQNRLWDCQSEQQCSPLVDDQLELRRLLHGQVGRLGTFQDLIDVGRGATEVVTDVDAVAHEAAGLRIFSRAVHGRQTALGGEALKARAIERKHRVRQYEQSLCTLSRHRGEGAVKLFRASDLQELQLNTQRLSR